MKEWQTYKQISDRFSYNPYDRLGGGSFGTVYKGYDAEMERYIAVKHITRTNLKNQRDIREVAIMNELKHPNILLCFGMEGSRNSPDGVFIFLQLCEKRTLKELIAQKMTQLRVYEIFRQLVDGMVYINQKGIFHRDLKPQNLLITAKDQLKIADFGIARQIKKQPITFKQGTFQYSAPEAFVDVYYDAVKGQYNEKCDVFSAGYVLFEMLTGERINKDIKDQLIFFKNNSKGYVVDHPALIPKWKDLIQQMLQFDVHKRPTFSDIREIMCNFQASVDILPAYRAPSQQQKQQSSLFLGKIKQLANLKLKRNNYYINILKAFHTYQQEISEIAPRIYKILLLFFSLSQYCCLSEDLLKLIDNRREFVLMDIKQSIAELEKRLVISDKANLNKCLREIYIKANKGKEEMKLFLLINVAEDIEKIQSQLAISPEKAVLGQFKVLNALRSWKENGEYQHIPTYEDGMTRCVNNMYQTSQQLHNLSIADLRIYLTVLYVSNLPSFIRLTEYSKCELPPSFEQILAMSSNELISQILVQRQREHRHRI